MFVRGRTQDRVLVGPGVNPCNYKADCAVTAKLGCAKPMTSASVIGLRRCPSDSDINRSDKEITTVMLDQRPRARLRAIRLRTGTTTFITDDFALSVAEFAPGGWGLTPSLRK